MDESIHKPVIITPAMIRAGVAVYLSPPRYGPDEDLVVEIFCAMLRASSAHGSLLNEVPVSESERLDVTICHVPISFARDPGEPIGTPFSELASQPGMTPEQQAKYENFKRIARSWGYD